MTPGNATDPAWIDHAAMRRLLDILGNDPGEFADVLSDYLVNATDPVARMSGAAGIGDAEAFRIVAHTLKSNARDFGPVRLPELCAEAEAEAAAAASTRELAAHAEEIARAERAARHALSEIDPAMLGREDDGA
jgi:HPt (histidine-containing phosphotransfer) domain-containing protein